MIVEILEGHNAVTSRTDKNGKVRFEQKAYAHLGGAFPVEFSIALESAPSAYPVGKYSIKPESYQVGRWGNLELNPFELKLQSVNQEFKKAS